MYNDSEEVLKRVEQLEQEVAHLRRGRPYRGIRKRSTTEFLGLPLWEIASSPWVPRRRNGCAFAWVLEPVVE